jgi:serine/threonine protein kinase
MQYQNINQYKKAVQESESFAVLAEGIEPVMDGYDPVFASGNFATVFKMWRNGRPHALKCFLKDISGREKRQEKIVDYIKLNPSKYFIDYSYLKKELWVDIDKGGDFPVTWMEWIDAPTMGQYIKKLCKINDIEALKNFTIKFKEFALWILDQPFAHGDLKHDNILIDEFGEIRLIDYDGMFVPSIKGEKAFELGGKDYQHPKRTANTFNENLDDFSVLIIYTSLLVLIEDPSLYDRYNNDQNIIFSKSDFLDFSASKLVVDLRKISSLKRYLDKIEEVLQNDFIEVNSLRLFIAGHMSADEFRQSLNLNREELKKEFDQLIQQIDKVVLDNSNGDDDLLRQEILDKRASFLASLNGLEKTIIEGGNEITIDWWDSLSSDWKDLFLFNIGRGNNLEKREILSEIIQLSKFKINFEFSNKIDNLLPLKNLVNLRDISIQKSKFDLAPLTSLKYLNRLKLNSNEVSLSPLVKIQSLKVLELPSNKVTIEPLQELINLKELSLKLNRVDLGPIAKIESLTKVSIDRGALDSIQSLIDKGITVTTKQLSNV